MGPVSGGGVSGGLFRQDREAGAGEGGMITIDGTVQNGDPDFRISTCDLVVQITKSANTIE